MASDYYTILSTVQTELQTATVASIAAVPDAQIYLRSFPSTRNITLPCIQITPGPPETLPGTLTSRDDYGYSALITIIQASNQNLTLSDTLLKLREDIIDHFIHQRLTGVSEVMTCFVEPGLIIDPGLWRDENLDSSQVVLRFVQRRSRG